MKKLNLAIIGQGRSGRDIHGAYYRSERNAYFNIKYVVDLDARRREEAPTLYPGCIALSDYRELYNYDDIDLVVNASYSEMHFEITKDLLCHGKNVLTEKPFARDEYECRVLMETAKQNGALLAVFQNTQLAPFYLHAYEVMKSGKIGDVKQISIRYNSLSRRWDWQTLQKKLAGGVYNTGPHPVAMALGFLDFDENARVVYSKLDTALTSGDSDDYAKIIIEAPNKPVIDIEINATDAFSDYNLKLQGSRGTMKSTPMKYTMKYIVEGENPPRPVVEGTLLNEDGQPVFCSEKLITHEESAEYDGTAFDVGTAGIYENVYYAITEGRPLAVPPVHSAKTIGIIAQTHAENPLPVKFI
jgi:predicted dehydrogenase